MWKRQCSSLVSSARTSLFATPALLTRMCAGPSSRSTLAATSSTCADLVTSSVHAGRVDAQPLQLGGGALDAVRHHVGNDHLGPGLAQRLGAGEADALAAAGDDGDAALEIVFLEVHGSALLIRVDRRQRRERALRRDLAR